jgi:hypothetical protein
VLSKHFAIEARARIDLQPFKLTTWQQRQLIGALFAIFIITTGHIFVISTSKRMSFSIGRFSLYSTFVDEPSLCHHHLLYFKSLKLI